MSVNDKGNSNVPVYHNNDAQISRLENDLILIDRLKELSNHISVRQQEVEITLQVLRASLQTLIL